MADIKRVTGKVFKHQVVIFRNAFVRESNDNKTEENSDDFHTANQSDVDNCPNS